MSVSKLEGLPSELLVVVAGDLSQESCDRLAVASKAFSKIADEATSSAYTRHSSLAKKLEEFGAPPHQVGTAKRRREVADRVSQLAADLPLARTPKRFRCGDPKEALAAARKLNQHEFAAMVVLFSRIENEEAQEFMDGLNRDDKMQVSIKKDLVDEWMKAHRDLFGSIRELDLSRFPDEDFPQRAIPQNILRRNGKVIDFLPNRFGFFTGLQVLNLDGLALNSLPDSLDKCPIRQLILSENYFKQIPEVVSQMQGLKILNLSGNRYLRGDLDRLLECPELEELRIENTDFTREEIRSFSDSARRLGREIRIVSGSMLQESQAAEQVNTDSQATTQPASMDLD